MTKRTQYIVISIALHALLLLLFVFLVRFDLLAMDDQIEEFPTDPIVLQLQNEQMRRELVETPDDAEVEEIQKDAELVSDKNALARNPEHKPELEVGDAYNEGEFEFRELPSNPNPPGTPGQLADNQQQKSSNNTAQPEEKRSDQVYVVDSTPKFTREYLTQTSANPGANSVRPKIQYDNQASSAPDLGSFSFNTYDWDFAPYMLALKRRVEENIFPPAAFYRLGIIDGDTRLRFRIYPDGEMTKLELLNYNGHKTLMETSMRAIEISAPFMPLPNDFPEEYLEVTASFHYLISKLKPYKKG